jgi:hypothetical protein
MTALCSSKLQAHWSPRPDLAKFDTGQAQVQEVMESVPVPQ